MPPVHKGHKVFVGKLAYRVQMALPVQPAQLAHKELEVIKDPMALQAPLEQEEQPDKLEQEVHKECKVRTVPKDFKGQPV